jgi:hypothetical protein
MMGPTEMQVFSLLQGSRFSSPTSDPKEKGRQIAQPITPGAITGGMIWIRSNI